MKLVSKFDLQHFVTILSKTKNVKVVDAFQGDVNVIRMRPYVSLEYVSASTVEQYNHALVDVAQDYWEAINKSQDDNQIPVDLFLMREHTDISVEWHPRNHPIIKIEFEPAQIKNLIKTLYVLRSRCILSKHPSTYKGHNSFLNQQAQNTNNV